MKLGKGSLKQRETCKKALRDFIDALVVKITKLNDPLVKDISVTCGLRGKTDQNKAYKEKKSKAQWPKSYHNNKNLEEIPADVTTIKEEQKSSAVDIVPYPQMWDSEEALARLGEIGKQVAKENGLNIEWGGDWKGSWDKPHWQIRK